MRRAAIVTAWLMRRRQWHPAAILLVIAAVLISFVLPATAVAVPPAGRGPMDAVAASQLATTMAATDYDDALNLASARAADVGTSSAIERRVADAVGSSLVSPGELLAPRTTGVLVEGAGSGTRTINFRPTTDPNWGLTRAHLDKHLFGSGPSSLRQIDAAGNPDLWRNYIQDLAGRPATGTLKGGIQDVIGTFPRADGSGTFQFGIRIAPGPNGSWDLVTLLTRQ